MPSAQFICPDLGKSVGDGLDLKDFGKYKITNIANYVEGNVDNRFSELGVRTLYIYTIEQTEKGIKNIH